MQVGRADEMGPGTSTDDRRASIIERVASRLRRGLTGGAAGDADRNGPVTLPEGEGDGPVAGAQRWARRRRRTTVRAVPAARRPAATARRPLVDSAPV